MAPSRVRQAAALLAGLLLAALLLAASPARPPALLAPASPPPPAVFTSLQDAARFFDFSPRGGGGGGGGGGNRRLLLPLVVGNNATTALTANLLASVARLPRPFPVLVVPMDAASLAHWAAAAAAQPRGRGAAARVNVLRDDALLRLGLPAAAGAFHSGAFNALSVARWAVARRALAGGADVWVMDPDLVYLADPFAFMAAFAPDCGYVGAVDTLRPFGYDAAAAGGGRSVDYGFVKSAHVVNWNVGQTLFRAGDAQLLAALDEFLALAADRRGEDFMDQEVCVARVCAKASTPVARARPSRPPFSPCPLSQLERLL